MREAVGGTMLMYIVFGFLLIYIFFMAVVINYGRVFRVKNSLISYIENQEGFKSAEDVQNLKSHANSLGYTGDIDICYTEGSSSKKTKYFSVQVYIYFQLPMVSQSIKIPITGTTSAIRNLKSESNTEGVSTTCGNGWQTIN